MAPDLSSARNQSILCIAFFIVVSLATAVWFLGSSPGFFAYYSLNNSNSTNTASSPTSDRLENERLGGISESNLTVEELRELKDVLQKASFNRTVILTPLNKAWASQNSMLDYLLESFRSGENTSQYLNNLVIIALDQIAYERCSQVHPGRCFKLQTPGVDFSSEKVFMSDDYLKMTRRKISFLTVVLQLGFNFIFTDGDLMWFRDPMPYFSPEADFEVSCDSFNGKEGDIQNAPNTGFIHVKSNNRTVELYKYWHKSTLKYNGDHDQTVFDRIKETREFQDIGVRIRFLPTKYFGCFCQPPADLASFYTMHANCCKGLQAKLADLRLVLDDWKLYSNQTSYERKAQITLRAPDACRRSWR